jgi:hypothetical protein
MSATRILDIAARGERDTNRLCAGAIGVSASRNIDRRTAAPGMARRRLPPNRADHTQPNGDHPGGMAEELYAKWVTSARRADESRRPDQRSGAGIDQIPRTRAVQVARGGRRLRPARSRSRMPVGALTDDCGDNGDDQLAEHRPVGHPKTVAGRRLGPAQTHNLLVERHAVGELICRRAYLIPRHPHVLWRPYNPAPLSPRRGRTTV